MDRFLRSSRCKIATSRFWMAVETLISNGSSELSGYAEIQVSSKSEVPQNGQFAISIVFYLVVGVLLDGGSNRYGVLVVLLYCYRKNQYSNRDRVVFM